MDLNLKELYFINKGKRKKDPKILKKMNLKLLRTSSKKNCLILILA